MQTIVEVIYWDHVFVLFFGIQCMIWHQARSSLNALRAHMHPLRVALSGITLLPPIGLYEYCCGTTPSCLLGACYVGVITIWLHPVPVLPEAICIFCLLLHYIYTVCLQIALLSTRMGWGIHAKAQRCLWNA